MTAHTDGSRLANCFRAHSTCKQMQWKSVLHSRTLDCLPINFWHLLGEATSSLAMFGHISSRTSPITPFSLMKAVHGQLCQQSLQRRVALASGLQLQRRSTAGARKTLFHQLQQTKLAEIVSANRLARLHHHHQTHGTLAQLGSARPRSGKSDITKLSRRIRIGLFFFFFWSIANLDRHRRYAACGRGARRHPLEKNDTGPARTGKRAVAACWELRLTCLQSDTSVHTSNQEKASSFHFFMFYL